MDKQTLSEEFVQTLLKKLKIISEQQCKNEEQAKVRLKWLELAATLAAVYKLPALSTISQLQQDFLKNCMNRGF